MSDVASKHPVDRLIREVIQEHRPVASEEMQQIVERLGKAPFNPWPVRVPESERGVTYQRHTLSAREASIVYHLVKRVAIEEQWASGTSVDQYLSDLRRTVRVSRARLAVYERRGDHAAAVVAATDAVLPPERRGAQWQPKMLVIYSADRGIIVTGYQFSTLEKTGIPEEAQWLR